MQRKIINQLNQLNLSFYQKFTESFSQTRSYYWAGWKKILPTIKNVSNKQYGNKTPSNKAVKIFDEVKVADIGCGTARFASFLDDYLGNVSGQSNSTQINYLGLDNSPHILQLAQKRLKKIDNKNFSWKLKNLDIINNSLKNLQNNLESKFDLITMFGVLHHVPSFELRQKIISQLLENLKPSGRLVVTLWRFPLFERLKKKIINPKIVNLDPKDLEKNDYILDWKKSGTGYRYCHYTTLDEMKKLTEGKGQIETTFLSDAKEQIANQYVIIRP